MFDANPALRNMFWPEADILPAMKFMDIVNDQDRPTFVDRYEKLINSDIDHIDERLDCIGAGGKELHAVVNLSSVRSDSGRVSLQRAADTGCHRVAEAQRAA